MSCAAANRGCPHRIPKGHGSSARANEHVTYINDDMGDTIVDILVIFYTLFFSTSIALLTSYAARKPRDPPECFKCFWDSGSVGIGIPDTRTS